ncbi:MAG TPA: hypothetical protein VF543_02860 [Pyrinomonadaceae bacterium]
MNRYNQPAANIMETMKRIEASVFRHLTQSLTAALNRAFDELHLEELGIEREKFTSFSVFRTVVPVQLEFSRLEEGHV